MYYIQFVLNVLIVLFIAMVFTIIYMKIANYVGKQLGFEKFFKYIWKKFKRK